MTPFFLYLALACTGQTQGDSEPVTDTTTDTEPACEKYADKRVLEQPFTDARCTWTGECPSTYGDYDNCIETFHAVFDLDSLDYDPCQAEDCLEALAEAESCKVQAFPEVCDDLLKY